MTTVTVDEFAQTVRASVSAIRNVLVRGNVDKVTVASSGHKYFDLVGDGGACVSCVAWSRSNVAVQPGIVEVHVRNVDYYPPHGKCQAVVDALVGHESSVPRRQRLLDALRDEGVLTRARRPLPDLVHHLCVITSVGSAAHADVMQGIRARWPELRTTVLDALVQGEHAPAQIVRAIARAQRLDPPADVIVCARGGGSASDLDAFDAESTVREIAASLVPVVTAVGHETDHSVADAVADVRAKTPTAAIELVLAETRERRCARLTQLRAEARTSLRSVLTRASERRALLARMLTARVDHTLRRSNDELARIDSVVRAKATATCERQERRVSNVRRVLPHHAQRLVRQSRAQLTLLACKVDAASPLAYLARGYACVRRGDGGALVRSIDDVAPENQIVIQVHDGCIEACVKRCRTK